MATLIFGLINSEKFIHSELDDPIRKTEPETVLTNPLLLSTPEAHFAMRPATKSDRGCMFPSAGFMPHADGAACKRRAYRSLKPWPEKAICPLSVPRQNVLRS